MIYFNVKEIRNYLLTHGIVYTIRNPRSEGITDAVQGSYMKYVKICKVNVKLIEEKITSIGQLDKYAFQSGITLPVTLSAFKADARQISQKWLDLAQKLSAQNGEQLNLYRVTIISEEPVAALLTTPFYTSIDGIKHYVNVTGMDEKLKADSDHCYCPTCNHRVVQTCMNEGCKCCTGDKKQ